jgi:hypothetical protein
MRAAHSIGAAYRVCRLKVRPGAHRADRRRRSASDHLSNAGSKSVTFSIIVTAQRILDDVKQFVAGGEITVDNGSSLLGLLTAAANARAAGNCTEANRI